VKKHKKIIVGNWKMNPESPENARAIFAKIKRAADKKKNTSVVICPPSLFLPLLAKNKSKNVSVGVQNVSEFFSGAHTGEISPAMVRESLATHVIIGHSERRAGGETNEIINKKILAAFHENLNVIFCIGEDKRDAEGGYLEFIKQELVQGLQKVEKKDLPSLVIAYEPIWAIGQSDKNAMKGAQMYEMGIYIKKILSEIFDRTTTMNVPILYGGSVSSLNAQDLVVGGHVDGLLVGRQSLNPEDFKEILNIVDSIKATE
jgi:triosephosphate isomerase